MTAEAIFDYCKTLGSVVDVVIITRFPFCYGSSDKEELQAGRIECTSQQEAKKVHCKLNEGMVSCWREW